MHVATADTTSPFKLCFHSVPVPLPRQQCKPLWKGVRLEGDSTRNPAGISVGNLEREGPEAPGVSLSRLQWHLCCQTSGALGTWISLGLLQLLIHINLLN